MYAAHWEDCDQNGENCAAIKGASFSTYTLGVSDEGHTVIVSVTASNPDATVSASSQPTAVVQVARR